MCAKCVHTSTPSCLLSVDILLVVSHFYEKHSYNTDKRTTLTSCCSLVRQKNKALDVNYDDNYWSTKLTLLHLQELQVDVRQAAGAQLNLYRAEHGKQLQGNDGSEPCTHRCHALHILQLPQTKAPHRPCIHILVLPALQTDTQDIQNEITP